jgi:hypothetical protein
MTLLRAFLMALVVLAGADDAEQAVIKAEEALERLRSGDRSVLKTRLYAEPHDAALVFARAIPSFEDDEDRARLVRFAVSLEREPLGEELSPKSENRELAGLLVAIAESDSSARPAREAAHSLLKYFSPEALEPCAAAVRAAATKWQRREWILLYGVLPSNKAEQVVPFIEGLNRIPEQDADAVDCVLARCGDAAAESRLMDAADALEEGVKIDRVFDALAYVPSQRMKRFVAEHLRTEEVLDYGGATLPKRNAYACALVQMMRDDETFPVKTGGYSYTDAELDQIEAWCTKNLGVEFPDGPRKEIPSRSVSMRRPRQSGS